MKELIVVLLIASVTFWLVKSVAVKFMGPEDFARRRNVWFALTVVAFLTPNFWVYALIAIPVYAWIGHRDSNPIAAYLLLMHIVPPVPIEIPALGDTQLFDLDNYRLLSFCILIPTALRARRGIDRKRSSESRLVDLLLIAFGLVQISLYVPPDLPNHLILQDSVTNLLRRAFLFTIDVFVLYYAISRSCNDGAKIRDAQATFCLASGLMALVAMFEHVRTWLLYQNLALTWNPADTNYLMSWLFRGDSWLRSQATAGHPICLGFLLSVAFGFWLYLQPRIVARRTRFAVSLVFWGGLIATYSRGPWIGAVLIYLAYAALKPRAVSRVFKSALIIAILLGLASLSPMGEKLMNSLHVTGGQSDSTFLYRQQLLTRSLELIQLHPFFGDQLATQKMEDLRQGQGIIDIVNTYIGVALFSGFVGFSLFLGIILCAGVTLYRAEKASIVHDSEWGLLGINILACLIGASFMIADSSLIFGVAKMFYILIALAAAYVRTVKQGAAPAQARALAQKKKRPHLAATQSLGRGGITWVECLLGLGWPGNILRLFDKSAKNEKPALDC